MNALPLTRRDPSHLRCPANSYVPEFEETEKMVELVQSYRELCTSINRVASRPFASNIDVKADDFRVGLAFVFWASTVSFGRSSLYPDLRRCLSTVPYIHSVRTSHEGLLLLFLLGFSQHETAERLEVLRRADRYEQALSVKDQMLWVALQASNLTVPVDKNRADDVAAG